MRPEQPKLVDQITPMLERPLCEPLITADRAAELLKLHPKTVKKLAQAGELPGMKIGRVWRFRESSIDAWMSARLKCCCHPSPKGEAFQ
jgi:excisionase family DNA binding protein